MSDAWRAELRRGLDHWAAGALEPATACFERAFALAPDRPETACALGRERRRAGRHAEAEPLLRAALRGDPGFTTAAGELARCLALGGGRLAEALAVLDAAHGEGADGPTLAVVRAEILLEGGRFDEAGAAATEAMASESGTVRDAARAALARIANADGVALVERGELDAALFAFKRASDLDPEWSGPLVNAGLAFERLGRGERARRAFQDASALEPDNPHALLNLGLSYAAQDQLDQARDALEAAWRAAPGWPPVACALAASHLEAGEISEALALLGEAAATVPSDAGSWLALATGFDDAGDDGRAEACLRAALGRSPDHAEARLRLAELLIGQDRHAEAARLADEARTLDPRLAAVVLDRRPRLSSDEVP